MSLIRDDTLQIWIGERLNGISHPISIESLWSEADLNAIGLYRIIPFLIPEGKRIVAGARPSYTIDQQAQKAFESYPVEDTPPPTAEELQEIAIKNDADRLDLVSRLTNASPEQIKNYVETDVTNLASAKQLLGRILLLLARLARD
jgi:hypothetical protein